MTKSRHFVYCIGILTICFLSLSLNTNCQANQQKPEEKTDTVTQNEEAIEREQQSKTDSCIPFVTQKKEFRKSQIKQHKGTSLVTKKIEFKKSQLNQCKVHPYKGEVSLDLSMEYPISGPEKMVRTLNKELLRDVCVIRLELGTVEYTHSWEELPQVLFNNMKSDAEGCWCSSEIDGTSMSLYAKSRLVCVTPKYATFSLEYFACRPWGGRTSYESGCCMYCADAKSGKLISFEDIFRKGCEDKLRTILYQELRKQYKYRERNYSDITESNLDLPYDVTLSPDGIIVSYSLYAFEPTPPPDDIEGISFKLPIAKVRPLLTPYAIELLEK